MGRRKGGRRARLVPAETEAEKISIPAAQRGLHAGPTPPYDPLSVSRVDRLIEATLEVMRDAGVAFDPDPPVMDLFRDAGCTVSDEGVVRFPSEVVRRCLDSMARSVRLWDRNGTDFIEIDNRHTWFIPGMTCIRVYDETGEPRDSTREDLARITRVADALPNVDAVTVTVKNVERSDIHGEVDEFMALAENTTKPLEYLCEYPESLSVVIDMAAAIRGGHEALAEKPYFLQLVTPLPMYYAKAHTDQILTAVEAGVPVGMGTVTIGGAAAPITMGGCIVHSLATDFAGMVLAQLARPGCFCIGGSDPNFMEVATGGVGSFTQTSLGDMAMCQVARRLEYPSLTGIGGCSVARRFNQDAVWELSASMMQTWYSRPATCDYMGSLDQGLTYSLHALLFCDELAGALRRMWEGVGVDDERLALELTRQEGPRGDYLTQAHTAKHCRTEPWDARFLGPHIPVSTGGDPDRDLFERIEEELCNILERHQPEPMPPRVRAALRGLQDDFEATHSVQE
jgi:trimethylamine:corrinoid methyltransferase-like protein